MNILYISSVCSQSRFDQLVAKGYINSQFQNQKFHHLLLKGLSAIEELSINVVSFYPINRIKGMNLKYEEEEENGVYYDYPNYTNKPIIHHIAKFLRTYQFLKKHRHSDSVIVCNIMNFDECLAALIYRFLHPIKICAVTADVPGFTSGSVNTVGAWWKRKLRSMAFPLYEKMISHYDAYMFLSQPMNDVVNVKKKPYIVVEGLADLSMLDVSNVASDKYKNRTVMYAGGLEKEYGLALLIDAFRQVKDCDVELNIYGKGNYEKEIKEATKEDPRIKYYGTKPNSEIVTAQLKSHLLINPRPTDAEFVKYSFPSKIIECMASGTPLLTTHIPSMPDEYLPYVFLIEDETVNGFTMAINTILSLSDSLLEKKGIEAKKFILNDKNYLIQSKKLLDLLENL